MAGPFFDVHVVGATDGSAKGLQALASALSGPLGMPAAAISKAVAERKLCAGKRRRRSVGRIASARNVPGKMLSARPITRTAVNGSPKASVTVPM